MSYKHNIYTEIEKDDKDEVDIQCKTSQSSNNLILDKGAVTQIDLDTIIQILCIIIKEPQHIATGAHKINIHKHMVPFKDFHTWVETIFVLQNDVKSRSEFTNAYIAHGQLENILGTDF